MIAQSSSLDPLNNHLIHLQRLVNSTPVYVFNDWPQPIKLRPAIMMSLEQYFLHPPSFSSGRPTPAPLPVRGTGTVDMTRLRPRTGPGIPIDTAGCMTVLHTETSCVFFNT
jgi:hypothetical protein